MIERPAADEAASLIDTFRTRWQEVSGEYIQVTRDTDVGSSMLQFIKDNRISSVVLAGSPLTPAIAESLTGHVEILADFGLKQLDRYTATQLCSQADAGITGVDALIAETGSIVIVSRGQGDRLCSLLPPTHLVVASEALVFSEKESFIKVIPKDMTISFITGPSRTADIEKQIVLGAHGPKRVVIWGPA